MNLELNVIIPVYNEEEIIQFVVEEWINTLNTLDINYKINLLNDGSTDRSYEIICEIKEEYQNIINVVDKKNNGHGPTIIEGYNKFSNSEWMFQVDSDNEMKAKYFKEMWNDRKKYDFLIGERRGRKPTFFRKLMSSVACIVVKLFYGKGIKDVNSPYRLFKNELFSHYIYGIPNDTFAPNIILTGITLKNNYRFKTYKIPFVERKTGKESLLNASLFKLLRISIKSFTQIIRYAIK